MDVDGDQPPDGGEGDGGEEASESSPAEEAAQGAAEDEAVTAPVAVAGSAEEGLAPDTNTYAYAWETGGQTSASSKSSCSRFRQTPPFWRIYLSLAFTSSRSSIFLMADVWEVCMRLRIFS